MLCHSGKVEHKEDVEMYVATTENNEEPSRRISSNLVNRM